MLTKLKETREWIPVKEAGQHLGVSRWWIWRRLKTDQLKGKYDHRGRLFILTKSINDLIANLPEWSEQ